MSRSYRHTPIGKQKSGGTLRFKDIFNRRIRRSDKTQDIPNGNAYKRYNNSYDISDYSYNCSWKNFQEWYWVKAKDWSEAEKYAYWCSHYRRK